MPPVVGRPDGGFGVSVTLRAVGVGVGSFVSSSSQLFARSRSFVLLATQATLLSAFGASESTVTT